MVLQGPKSTPQKSRPSESGHGRHAVQVANVCSYKLGYFQFLCELGWFLHGQSHIIRTYTHMHTYNTHMHTYTHSYVYIIYTRKLCSCTCRQHIKCTLLASCNYILCIIIVYRTSKITYNINLGIAVISDNVISDMSTSIITIGCSQNRCVLVKVILVAMTFSGAIGQTVRMHTM